MEAEPLPLILVLRAGSLAAKHQWLPSGGKWARLLPSMTRSCRSSSRQWKLSSKRLKMWTMKKKVINVVDCSTSYLQRRTIQSTVSKAWVLVETYEPYLILSPGCVDIMIPRPICMNEIKKKIDKYQCKYSRQSKGIFCFALKPS